MFESHQWLPVPRHISAPLLLLLCFATSSAAPNRILQDEASFVEFEVPATDTSRTGLREMVSGWFYVKGTFSLGSLGDVAFATREMLANVCDNNLPTLVLARQDILTISEPEVGLNMTFYVMPPPGWSHYCVAMLRFAGYGPTTPPFTVASPPPIRQMLEVSVGQNTGLNERLVDEWVIDIGNVNCLELMASYGSGNDPEVMLERSRMPDEWRGREEPSPCGSVEAKWVPSSSVKLPWEEEPCKAAASACICASIPTCRFLAVPGGSKRCTNGWQTAFDTTSVSCEDCPYQPKCPPTCKDAYTPCTCTFWNCTWDESRSLCAPFDPNAGDLSCLLCSRQPHCVGLEAVAVEPAEWSVLEEEGWLVNVTFNRRIMFGPLMQSEPSSLHFRCQSEEELAQVPPASMQYDLDRNKVKILEDTLQINTKEVPNDLIERYCQLTAYQGSILDLHYIPFEGIWRSHRFILGDTVAPTLQSISPENSAIDAPLNVTVRFTFSEIVSIGLGAGESFRLISLGGEGLQGPESEEIAIFPGGSPRVQLKGDTLTLQLEGALTYDTFYTIGIASNAVQDKVGNQFSGLTTGFYAFRTVARKGQTLLEEPGALLSTAAAFTIVFASILILSGLTVGALALWQRRRSRSISPEPVETQEIADKTDHADFETMKELHNLKSWHGPETFETLFEELRGLQKEQDENVAYKPPLDDSYYATMEPLSAGSSTVLEPDMTLINKARPMSANRSSGGEGGSTVPDAVEVYEYYAFPPSWSMDDTACPPSSGPPALMDAGDLSVPSTQRMLEDSNTPTASKKVPELRFERSQRPERPLSAHERSKTIIRSLHHSLQSAKVPPRARSRPQSAPSQRVQERLIRSQSAALFREFDRRIPTLAGNSRPESRPSSAAFQRQAIADHGFDYALHLPRRPTSAGAIQVRRSQTAPVDFREGTEHQALDTADLPVDSASKELQNYSGLDNEHRTDRTQEKKKDKSIAVGMHLEELRSLGLVSAKPQNVRWSGDCSEGEVPTAQSLFPGARQSLRSRQSRVSVVIEQESDKQTWEMMLKKAATVPVEKPLSPEQSPRNAPRIGMPWTWQSSSIDAVDSEQHKDSLASRETAKSSRWNRKSYIWQFQNQDEEEKPATKVTEDEQAGSLGKRHEALGIRSRSSILRTHHGSFDEADDKAPNG